MHYDFSDIPGFSNIFLDYINEFENVEKYYKINFRNEKDFFLVLDNVEKKKDEREKLVQIIKNQYAVKEPSLKTINNINSLSKQKTFAIVTGQQLGLLTGPLYTIFKTISTIKLCHQFNSKYPDYYFVPVFWLEGDDHDFDEVRKIKILDNENSLKTIVFSDGLSEETNRGPIGKYQFDSTIEETVTTIQQTLRETEFKPKVMELIKANYFPGSSFKDAFVNLFFEFFDKHGLIIFDPQDIEAKKLMKPVFKKDLENFKFFSEELIRRSAELDIVYHAQIKINPVNLFYLEDEGRYLIEPTGNEFRLKGKRKKFSYESLLEQIESNPEKFSPNVVLRPICQDTILPTAVYVAGPSEISYFAQIIPYYHMLNITPPILYPRVSATIIESKVKNILDKYNLQLINFFLEIDKVTNNIIENLSEVKTTELFSSTEEKIFLLLDELSQELSIVDPTLTDIIKNTKQKIEQYLNVVQDKTLLAARKKNEIILRQIYKTANILFPDENLQEREINVIYFLNKYGLEFVDYIYDKLDVNIIEHQVIEI